MTVLENPFRQGLFGAVNSGGALGLSADVRRYEEVRAASAASYVIGAILNVDGGSELGAAFDPAR